MYDIVVTLFFITVLLFVFLGQLQQGVPIKKQFINDNENIAVYDYQTKTSTHTDFGLVRSNGNRKISKSNGTVKPIKYWFENMSNVSNIRFRFQ